MRKFNITVNGNSYEVEVEEIGGGSSVQRPVAPKLQQKVAKVPSGGNTVTAPMPGTILDIKVKEGDTVNSGDVLLILEAMKMENEIMAPSSGKVVSIHTTKGTSVDAEDVLIVLG